MIIKWYGTASIELMSNGQKILFDPFVPLRGSNIPVSLNDYEGVDTIFVTHGHFDHILSLPGIVKRNPNVKIFCSETPFATLIKKGVPERNLEQIKPSDVIKLENFTVRAFHGKHAVLPRATFRRIAGMFFSKNIRNIPLILREHRMCRENDETIFYLVEAEGKTVSLMGSLNIRNDVSYPVGSDLLVLPYNGWEDNYPPAISVIDKLKPKEIILDHFDDTFPPVTSHIDTSPIINKYTGQCRILSLYEEGYI